MTKSSLIRDKAVMMSSVMPSAKNSWSRTLLMFVNGSTAIDGLSGSVGLSLAPSGLMPPAERHPGGCGRPEFRRECS